MKNQEFLSTGLYDDYGTEIMDGDTLEWTYYKHGIMMKNDDGSEYFLGGYANEMVKKKFIERRKIEYEVRGDMAGYFLDRPEGMATMYIKEESKCRVVK